MSLLFQPSSSHGDSSNLDWNDFFFEGWTKENEKTKKGDTVTPQEQLLFKLSKVKTKRQHNVRLWLPLTGRSVQTKDSLHSPLNLTRENNKFKHNMRFYHHLNILNKFHLDMTGFCNSPPPLLKCVYPQQRATTTAQVQQWVFFVCFFRAWCSLWIQHDRFSEVNTAMLLYSPPGSDLSKTQHWWKYACWRKTEMFFSLLFFKLNKWLSSSQALVHVWCCQMGTYCCVLWVLTDLIFSPYTGFCCVFCVSVMDWHGYFGTETSPRGREMELWLTAKAGQWVAALPSGSHGKDGNQVERSIRWKWKVLFLYFLAVHSFHVLFGVTL